MCLDASTKVQVAFPCAAQLNPGAIPQSLTSCELVWPDEVKACDTTLPRPQFEQVNKFT